MFHSGNTICLSGKARHKYGKGLCKYGKHMGIYGKCPFLPGLEVDVTLRVT